MKTAALDKNHPKLATYGGLRQGTLTFVRHVLRMKRRTRISRFRIRRDRNPRTGGWWYSLEKSS